MEANQDRDIDRPSEATDFSDPLITTTFVIEGDDLDPAECSRRIGLEPTGASDQRKVTGHLVPSGEPYVRKPFWLVKLNKRPSDSIGDELNELLAILWPHRHEIVRYLQETGHEAGFSSSVTIEENRPLYELTAETLSRLSFFKVDWILDILE